MVIGRTERFKSRKLLDAAKGRSCVACGRDDGTIVPAHLPGSFYGMPAGVGQKIHDWLVAHLCLECHEYSENDGRRDAEWRMRVLCKTLERLFEEGVIIVA